MTHDDPSDHSKVKSVLTYLARHVASPAPSVGRGKTVRIDRCAACPFASSDTPTVCEARPLLNKGVETPPIARIDFLSGPPPDWCPLRAGPVTLEVRG